MVDKFAFLSSRIKFPRLAWSLTCLSVVLLAACGGKDDLLASAKKYLAQSDSKAAVIQLKNLLQTEPNSPEVRFLLGKALLAGGDAASAKVELEKALDLDYSKTQIIPLLARSMIATREYQKLIGRFGQIQLSDPGPDAELKAQLATAYAMGGQLELAQKAIVDSLRAVPGNASALLLKARLAAEQKDFDGALKIVEEVIATSTNDAEAWHYKGQFLLYGKADPDGASAAYQRAIAANPELAEVRVSLISILLARGNIKAAAGQVEELRKRQPGRPQTVYVDAQLAFYEGNYKKARELTQQLLKFAPDSIQVLQLAGALSLNSGALLDAERMLSKALQEYPNLPVARQLLARTYLRLNQTPKALAVLQPLLSQPDVSAQTLSLAAEAFLQIGDLVQAENHFMRASRVDPADTKSRADLALTRIRLGSPEAGLAELKSISAAGKDTYADLAMVSIYMRTKDYDRALTTIDDIEVKQPGKSQYAELRGQIQLLMNDKAGARKSLERALAIDPAYLPAVARLALLDLSEEKPALAKSRFESVLKADPSNLQALLALTAMRKREGASKEEVAAMLLNAAKLNPADVTPRVLLVEHFLSVKDRKAALVAAQEGAATLPDNPQMLDVLGRLQLDVGETNQAISSFNKFAAAAPQSPQPYMRLAGLYLSIENTEAALQNARRALSITPNLIEAQQLIAGTEAKRGRHEEATKIARTMQRQRPDEPVGYMLEGAIETARKNYTGAIWVYKAAAKRFAGNQAVIKLHTVYLAAGMKAEARNLQATWMADHPTDSSFVFYLGKMSLGEGNYAAAAESFRKVVLQDPQNAPALNNLAWCLTLLNQDTAVAYAEKANSLVPNAPPFMNTLATALAAQKQLTKAIEIQKKALDLSEGDPSQRLSLAKMYLQSGDKGSARAELEVLASMGAKFSSQAEVEKLRKQL